MNPARFAARHPWLIIVAHLAVAVVAVWGLRGLRQTDDLLAFLPPGDPDVKVFNEASEKFGTLRVALIGFEAPEGQDVLSAPVLRRIEKATELLRAVHGVDGVDSLTSIPDIVASPLGAQAEQLIQHIPTTEDEHRALREHVLSRSHFVGRIISSDARAARILVYLATSAVGDGKTPVSEAPSLRDIAHRLHDAAESALAGGGHIYYGGLPFWASAIFEETQNDIRKLSPLAILVIFGLILISFRDPVGVALTVLTVGWSVLVLMGGMGFANDPFTVASGAMPVIVFASGSSYAVHVLGRYYALRERRRSSGESKAAIVEATGIVVAPVTIAGLTTSAGFFSFLVMDIIPMRNFGLECAIGVLLCWSTSLTLVPAVISLWPRPYSAPIATGAIGGFLSALGDWARRRRLVLFIAAGAAAAFTVGPMLRVEVRMEPSAFFRKGSEPWLALRFLDRYFGGSQILFPYFSGDMTDPATLREIQRFSEFALTQPGVTQIDSILGPMQLVGDAMGVGAPETRAQSFNLLFFLEGQPSLRRLLTPDRGAALVLIGVRGDPQPAMHAIEQWLKRSLAHRPAPPTRGTVGERIGWIASAAGVTLPPATIAQILDGAHPLEVGDPQRVAARRQAALGALAGEGDLLPPLADKQLAARIAETLANRQTLAPEDELRAAFIKTAPSPEEGEQAWNALTGRLADVSRRLAVSRALAVIPTSGSGALPPRARRAVEDALLDLLPLRPLLTAPRDLYARLTGEPVLDRGMSHSVGKNQERSLIVSMIAVLLLMLLLFRSVKQALVSVLPAALTMAVLFGAMGLFGVRIDIGTSLVASIATGAGSDFAMHYLWYLRRSSHDEVVKFVGPIMVISTLLVAFGFAVLALGKSQPMRMFGSLAAGSMALAAALTFLLVPALIGRVGAAALKREEIP